MPETVLKLQRTLAALALDSDPAPFAEDPGGFAARMGLGPGDQAAFIRFADRLPAYREQIRLSLADPIEAMFPLTQALLEQRQQWQPCLDRFLAARVVTSPHYRDVAPAFLAWLADTGWGQDTWPCILQLAHFEILESLIDRHPETPPATGLDRRPGPWHRIQLDPATQVVAYTYAVTEASLEQPDPRAQALQLLAYRDPEGAVRWLELSPALAALIMCAQTEPLAQAAQALAIPDLGSALALLTDFCELGAIQGFLAPD